MILSLCIVTMMAVSFAHAQKKRYFPSKRKHFSFLFHYGNLTGFGLGCEYALNDAVGFDVVAGIESPAHLGWTSPYTGNLFNGSVRIRVTHPVGFYVSPGWYAGLFEISRKLRFPEYEFLDSEQYVLQSGPMAAVGFEWPRGSRKIKCGVEVGCAWLPKEISKTVDGVFETYRIDAERSGPAMGSVFPFFTFIVRI